MAVYSKKEGVKLFENGIYSIEVFWFCSSFNKLAEDITCGIKQIL